MENIGTKLRRCLNQVSKTNEKIEEKLFEKGKLLDHYIDKQTPGWKYMLEILSVVPMVFITHHWSLVAPYSNYKIVNIVLLVLWLAGSLLLFSLTVSNIRTKLRGYINLSMDLCFAWITNINYWTYQQEVSETCDEVNVFIWTDIVDNYTIPVLITLVIQWLYFIARLAIISNNDYVLYDRFVIIVFATFLLVDLVPLVGIFPVVLSELSYWFHFMIHTLILSMEMLQLTDLDIKMLRKKINEVREMAETETDMEHKNKLVDNLRKLVELLRVKETGNAVNAHLPGQWFMRDCLSFCAIVYYIFALLIEIIVNYGSNGNNTFDVEFIVLMLTKWTTSLISLIFFSSLLSCIANICIGGCFYFLTHELRVLTEVMNSNTGGVLYMATLSLFLESNFLGLSYTEREHAMQIVLGFSFYIICGQIRDVVENKVMYVVNSGTVQDFSFFLRFGILVGLFITLPCIMTYKLSQSLETDFFPLFIASCNLNLTFLTLSLLVECLLTSLKWHTVQYRNKIEDILQKMRFIKSCIFTVLIFSMGYFRYNCVFFKAWWLYRLVLVMFSSCVTAGLVVYSEWLRHKKRQQLSLLMSTLINVHFDDNDNETDCPICFSKMSQGVLLPCRHSFHRDCVRHWFEIRQVCPTCNVNV